MFGLTDWPLTLNFLHASICHKHIACRGLKVKVMGQANAVDLSSIEGSFSSGRFGHLQHTMY